MHTSKVMHQELRLCVVLTDFEEQYTHIILYFKLGKITIKTVEVFKLTFAEDAKHL
jgi:hypothetical protein